MSRKHYDPSIPSVTEIIDPLIREELNKIPKFRLDIAGAKGIQRHKEFDDFIKNQKHCGVPTQLLSQALTLVAPKGKVLSEQYKKINGVLQGTVDVVSDD
ncbi:MAG: hypothetical protein KAS32_14485, partial [Candidatus Peribacteraceae bacterium]|nr:hypothetical protein [Candidatus Peribacteraceae bacterium]